MCSAPRVSGLRLLAPIAWTGLIAWFSTDMWGGAQTGPVLIPFLQRLLPWASTEHVAAAHWLARKIAHALEYGVLAVSWRWALGGKGRPGWVVPLALCILTAALDEFHQSAMPGRSAQASDVVLDAAGAASALIALGAGARAVFQSLTGGLLWVAAAGGTALLVLDWRAGVLPGWLWWSIPAAWVGLALWRKRCLRD